MNFPVFVGYIICQLLKKFVNSIRKFRNWSKNYFSLKNYKFNKMIMHNQKHNVQHPS